MSFATAVHQCARGATVLAFFAFPVSVALANVALLLVLVLGLLAWAMGALGPDLRRALANPMGPAALCLFAWICLSALWSPADAETIGGFAQKYLKFLLIPLFIALLQDATTRRRCWQAFAVALLITLAVTWLNVWFDFSWTRTHNQGFGKDHTVFKDHISQGIMMSLLASLSGYMALKSRSRNAAVTWWVVSALAAISILFLSTGRTGYLSWALSMLVFGLGVGLARSRTVVWVMLAAGSLMLALAVATSVPLQQRLGSAWEQAISTDDSEVTSIGARKAMNAYALEQSVQAPIAGHGLGAYPALSPLEFTEPGWCAVVCEHPHNQFLFFLFEQGLIGLALFAWFLWTLALSAWRESPDRRALALAFLAILLVSNNTHSSFWLSTESHFFVLMGALFMASMAARAAPRNGG